MTDRELMQQALDTLTWNLPLIEDFGDKEQLHKQHKAIANIDTRLAQHEANALNDRELMQQVLNALKEYINVVVSVNDPNEWEPKVVDGGKPAREAIEALRARLAQPEPEPVAWMEDAKGNKYEIQEANKGYLLKTASAVVMPDDLIESYERGFTDGKAQREWQRLTDEEIEKMRHLIDWTAHWSYGTFARAIEAKLKEKNT